MVINSKTTKTTLWRYAGLMAYNFNSIRLVFRVRGLKMEENYKKDFCFWNFIQILTSFHVSINLRFSPRKITDTQIDAFHTELYKYFLAIFAYHSNALNRIDWNWFSVCFTKGMHIRKFKNHLKHFLLLFQSSNEETTNTHKFFLSSCWRNRQLWPSLVRLEMRNMFWLLLSAEI